MHILICHERFLFRFGADRVLILLGQGLKQMGHQVSIMANRYDREVVETFADPIIDVPGDLGPYLDLNELTAKWLEENWDEIYGKHPPEIVIVGGWPFFSAIPFFRKKCRQVIVIEFGVVPTGGYDEGIRITLDKLKQLRRQTLPHASLIAPISGFLARSQAAGDSGGQVPIRTVLLGADHMTLPTWKTAEVQGAGSGQSIGLLRRLKKEERQTVLCLGRWEPGCYKNSQAAFEVMETVLKDHPEAALLILAEKADIPEKLRSSVFPLGFPDDKELQEVMTECDAAISLSLWEGFNLPIAEMQWLNREALAFNVGAHPEVIAHPWYLCADTAEMAAKLGELLDGRGPGLLTRNEALKRFQAYFTWQRYIDEFAKLLDPGPKIEPRPGFARIFIDVTNSTIDPANSGVIRVTRRFSRALQEQLDPVFVVWDASIGHFVFPTERELDQLGQFNGPAVSPEQPVSPPGLRIKLADRLSEMRWENNWLILPEVMLESRFAPSREFARQHRLQTAAIFYDSIPVLRPDLCNDEMRNNHKAYMNGLAECDVAIPISHFSGQCLAAYWKENGLKGSLIATDVLPGEFGGSARNREIKKAQPGPVHILCVSTLEPRKNHYTLLRACLLMGERYPDLDWKLTLVGNRYHGGEDLVEYVQHVMKTNPRVHWTGIVDDTTLLELYRQADFTVYPSIIEGFGLPVLESVWHGRPCICNREGVMAELAAEGGCLTVDVLDEKAMMQAIHRLATDTTLREKLTTAAVGRRLRTWDDYVNEFLVTMQTNTRTASAEAAPVAEQQQAPVVAAAPAGAVSAPTNWSDVLYSKCLTQEWQMFDSERLALAGLLARHRPKVCIEIGTYRGGSLSLISQFSQTVFSIDIDPEVVSRYQPLFPNVAFLTGPSQEILPRLLAELDAAGMSPDFILVDGDHSPGAVERDLNIIVDYVPKKPLFVMMHDSFNPGCRSGMARVTWSRSPHVHWVDLDFVPGRLIEHGGPSTGEMWGGLGMFFMSPATRQGDAPVAQSALSLFNAAYATPAAQSAHGVHT